MNDDTKTIGYADVIAVYMSAEPQSPAWTVADDYLRRLQLQADAKRLLTARVRGGR